MTALEWAALGSVAWALLALAASAVRAWRRGAPSVVAAPAGKAWNGVAYAFGRGMSPRAKESAAQHPWIYAAGALYHAGIAAGVVTFVLVLLDVSGIPTVSLTLAAVQLAAALAGLALAARRGATPLLRAISAPDDYASNLLVDAWLASAAFELLSPSARPAFLVLSTVLAGYAPLGKIRHCVFFVLARAQFGARLGRRGLA